MASSPPDPRKTLLDRANARTPINFVEVPTTFRNREQYYRICGQNVEAEFLSALYEARLSLKFRICHPVQRTKDQRGGLLVEIEPVDSQHTVKLLAQTGTGAGQAGGSCTALVLAEERAAVTGVAVNSGKVAEEGKMSKEQEVMAQLAGLKDNVVALAPATNGQHDQLTKFLYVTNVVEELPRIIYANPVNKTQRERNQRQRIFLKGFGFEHFTNPKIPESSLVGGSTYGVVAFVGDYMSRYRCAKELAAGTPTILEQAILQPGKQAKTSLVRRGGRKRAEDQLLPINASQHAAVQGFSKRISVIEGPPGTGKSTTIYHILNAYIADHVLPGVSKKAGAKSTTGSRFTPARTTTRKTAAALVTCVTNQAVNAVMEKLGPLDGFGISPVVLGNESKIGAHAAAFTLNNKVKNDPLVLFMTKACGAFGLMANRVREGQENRVNALLGGVGVEFQMPQMVPKKQSKNATNMVLSVISSAMAHFRSQNREKRVCCLRYPQPNMLNKSRLTPVQIATTLRRNSPEFYASRAQELRDKQISEKEFHVFLEEEHLRIVNEVRVRMMTAFVNRKYKKTTKFYNMLKKCHDKTLRWKAYLTTTAKHRTIRDANVFLFTIASGHRLMQLKNDFEDAFPDQIQLGILDEAGATAETYIPLLLKTDIQNLVLLGDVRQLRPLVIAPDSEDVDGKQANRSLMERCLKAKCGSTMLREQYRMPRKLCTLVSRLFYDGKLETPSSKVETLVRSVQLRWVNCGEEELKLGTSYIAPQQCLAVAALLQGAVNASAGEYTREILFSGDLEPPVKKSKRSKTSDAKTSCRATPDLSEENTDPEVMVICMYLPQMRFLRAVLPTSLLQSPSFRLVTVDAAQGTEADHVVLVAGRCNKYGKVGFTKVKNRLNVAISRAKQSLTVVGCKETMRSNAMWRQVLGSMSVSEWTELEKKAGKEGGRGCEQGGAGVAEVRTKVASVLAGQFANACAINEEVLGVSKRDGRRRGIQEDFFSGGKKGGGTGVGQKGRGKGAAPVSSGKGGKGKGKTSAAATVVSSSGKGGKGKGKTSAAATVVFSSGKGGKGKGKTSAAATVVPSSGKGGKGKGKTSAAATVVSSSGKGGKGKGKTSAAATVVPSFGKGGKGKGKTSAAATVVPSSGKGGKGKGKTSAAATVSSGKGKGKGKGKRS